jgi:hypothetical protein
MPSKPGSAAHYRDRAEEIMLIAKSCASSATRDALIAMAREFENWASDPSLVPQTCADENPEYG